MADVLQPEQEMTRDARFRDTASSPTPEPLLAEGATITQHEQIPPAASEASFVIAPIVKDVDTKHLHLFSSYAERPAYISFHNQDSDEAILLFLRSTLITNIPWLLFALLAVLAPIFFFLVFPLQPAILSAIPLGMFVVLTLTYYHIVTTFVFVKFLKWYFNICLVTNKRIVDVDFTDLVYKNVAETKLSLVQDVSYTQSNATSTVFNYGNVLVQTAGTIENFELHRVPNPERVVEVLENLIGKGWDTSDV